MFIRSQDKTTLLNFNTGMVYQDGQDIVYAAEPEGNEVILATYKNESKATAVFEIFVKNHTNAYFDFSAQQ